MKNTIKTICTCIVVSLLINGLATLLQSQFIKLYLDANLLTLLIALFAINTTTLSVILTKLKELSDKNDVDFSASIKEMHNSIIEQVIIIGLGLVFQIIQNSAFITSQNNPNVQFGFAVGVLAIFIYALDILYDTANGIFVIMNYEKRTNN
jgi:magnesium-transporting ATPase (P-type)